MLSTGPSPPVAEEVFGIPFWCDGNANAVAAMRDWLADGRYFNVAFANPEFLLVAEKDAALAAYLRQCRAVYADGAGIVWASKLQGGRIRERITGTDFQWHIFELADELGLRLYLFGGRPGIAATAAAKIHERVHGLQGRIGCCDGYMPREQALARIKAYSPDIIMVCLGNPLQEAWIGGHGEETGARLVFGNGGALDFIAGQVRRAPAWMRDRGFEWLWRLAQDLSWTRIRRQARLSRYLVKLVRLMGRRR